MASVALPRAFFLCALSCVANISSATAQSVCTGFGPQSPRDIDQTAGNNKRVFSLAPPASQMNLCNLHIHQNAEHRAADFSIPAENGGSGFQCTLHASLSRAERKPTKQPICHGLKPGDTIEVHWVHSSCDVKPGKGLGSCLNDSCPNPNLRVEAQVFTLVNDTNAVNFNTLDYGGISSQGYHQAKFLPINTGKPVTFLGSTTGPQYSDQQCSSLQVTWSVRPQCAKLDINSLAAWCAKNDFEEDHAHGVRKLVINPELLSEIH